MLFTFLLRKGHDTGADKELIGGRDGDIKQPRVRGGRELQRGSEGGSVAQKDGL